MADATARFAVQLDEDVSGAADAAAGALDKLEKSIEKDQKSLKDLERAMNAAKKATFDSKIDYIGLASAIQTKRNAVASASADFIKLGGSFGEARGRAKEGAAAARALGAGLAALHSVSEPVKESIKFNNEQWGRLAATGRGFAVHTKASLIPALVGTGKAANDTGADLDSLARATKKAGFGAPDNILDLAEAFSTLPGAILTATAALAAFSAAVIGAGVIGIFELIGAAISAQEELEGMSDAAIRVAKRSPIARAEISKLADELAKTGLKGAALEDALDKAVKKKFGKEAEKDMRGFSVQLAKAKENAVFLFTGVHTQGLLDTLAKMLKFLDASTVEGGALKALIETMLNPILDGIRKAGPAAKQFFQGMIIGALEVAIALLLVKKRIESVVGSKLDLKAVDWTTVGEAVAFAAAAFGLAAVAIGVVAGLIVGSVAAVGALAFAFGVVLVKVGEAAAGIPAAIMSVNNFIISRVAAFIDAGFQMAAGIADGIRNGASEVITAATEMAQSAINAVKDTLKMHSPSRVMVEAGQLSGESLAMGQENAIPGVEDSAAGLGEAMVPPATGGALQAQGGGGGAQVTIQQLIVNGVEGADDPNFDAKIAEALARAMAILGLEPAA